MYVILEIPNIPLKEAEKAIKYMSEQIKNFQISESFIWRDGIGIFWKKEDLIIKGPKLSEEDKKNLIKKNYNLSDAASNFIKKNLTLYKVKRNENNFYEENNILYFKTYQQFNLINIIKNIPWLKPMKILNDKLPRPIKKIYLSYETNEVFASIIPEKKDFTPESFKEFYKQKNILVNFEEKINHIRNLNIFNENIIKSFYSERKNLIHNTSIPYVILIPLKDKYKNIPDYLIEYIISIEQNVIGKYENNKLAGFYFILDHKLENINIDKFSIVINSRLEDLNISYERDKKLVLFNNKYENKKLFNLIYELEKFFNLNLQKNILEFIMKNLKNDFSTTLVEEYPNLLGILSGLIYKEKEKNNYNQYIEEAFWSISGNIKNHYGLLIYISEKLNFLMEVTDKNQLATSTKDPFATKDITDKILKLLEKNNLSIPYDFMTDTLKDFFKKRLELYKKK